MPKEKNRLFKKVVENGKIYMEEFQ